MAYSRKDGKGRALRKGESFRKDKDMYVYKYVDPFGKAKYLYSKDLAKLREKEERLLKDQMDGLDIYAMGKSTVNFVYDRYIKTKTELRKTTRANYDYTYDHYVRDDFGKRKIAEIKYSDVLYFYQYLADEEELSISTIESVHTLLHPTFQLAVRDDIIRKNPSDNVLAEIKKKWGKTIGVRHALTISQQRIFLEVLEQPENLKWKPIIVFLLGTGCRAGEMIAIRWKDLDFNERTISINHAASFLAGHNGAGDGGFIISKPKTEAGIRMIPMLDSVYEVLEEHAAICRAMGKNDLEVDGMSGFVFLNRYGNLFRSQSINKAIKRMCDDYNFSEEVNAKKEHREMILLPHFSCHHLRHTFCTRLCEAESNLKLIQSIMGHSDITTTMNIYAEVMEETKKAAFSNLSTKLDVFGRAS